MNLTDFDTIEIIDNYRPPPLRGNPNPNIHMGGLVFEDIKESYLMILLSFINMNLLNNYNDYQAFIAAYF